MAEQRARRGCGRAANVGGRLRGHAHPGGAHLITLRPRALPYRIKSQLTFSGTRRGRRSAPAATSSINTGHCRAEPGNRSIITTVLESDKNKIYGIGYRRGGESTNALHTCILSRRLSLLDKPQEHSGELAEDCTRGRKPRPCLNLSAGAQRSDDRAAQDRLAQPLASERLVGAALVAEVRSVQEARHPLLHVQLSCRTRATAQVSCRCKRRSATRMRAAASFLPAWGSASGRLAATPSRKQ
eukprot:1817400-Pleurochrysis_carterae.AAC.1